MSNPHTRVGSKEKPFKPCLFLSERLITEYCLLQFNQYSTRFKTNVSSIKKNCFKINVMFTFQCRFLKLCDKILKIKSDDRL